MKQLTLFHSPYLSSYPWSRREAQVISLAASFLWFCAQRRHVRWKSCEENVLSPCRKVVLWSGVHERKHLWKGTVISLSIVTTDLKCYYFGVYLFGLPTTPFLFF